VRTVTFCAIGSVLALSLGLVTIGPTATFASKITNVSRTQQVIVDRSHKGDRMTPATTVVQKTAPRSERTTSTQPRSRLPEGCDPMVSPLAGAATAGMTGRCMS
jgi:hypothetical protein